MKLSQVSIAKISCTIAFTAMLLAPLPVRAWGEYGHRISGQVAAQNVPNEMPAFFRNAIDQLTYLNPEPDRWRDFIESKLDPALNGTKAPEHYIDTERLALMKTGMLELPVRDAFLMRAHEAKLQARDIGLLPYEILERFQQLRVEFRLWRAETDPRKRAFIEQRIINDAGILGHYVTDGANPHHTTVQHNGWTGENPRGYTTDHPFHNRFETTYVDSHIKIENLQPLVGATKPRVLTDMRAEMTKFLQDSNSQVEPLYQLEQREKFDDQTKNAAHKFFTMDRLTAGILMLRDIWWTAWITSEVTPEQKQMLENSRKSETPKPKTPKR
ncbi:MAG: hypothetical protein NVSMB56_07880 [Pyrinomonadaceae bacterium]